MTLLSNPLWPMKKVQLPFTSSYVQFAGVSALSTGYSVSPRNRQNTQEGVISMLLVSQCKTDFITVQFLIDCYGLGDSFPNHMTVM